MLMRRGATCGSLGVTEAPISRGEAMSQARVVRRRSKLAEAVERAAVVERPVVGRGPLYLVHPTVTAACVGSLQRIAGLLRDESYPIAPSVLDAVEAFVCDGASPFFGRDVASAQREVALLQHLVETGQKTWRSYGRSSARGVKARRSLRPTGARMRSWGCPASAAALPDPELEAEAALAERADAEQLARLEADLRDEHTVRVRQPSRPTASRFFRSTSSRYLFRPGRPLRTCPQTTARPSPGPSGRTAA